MTSRHPFGWSSSSGQQSPGNVRESSPTSFPAGNAWERWPFSRLSGGEIQGRCAVVAVFGRFFRRQALFSLASDGKSKRRTLPTRPFCKQSWWASPVFGRYTYAELPIGRHREHYSLYPLKNDSCARALCLYSTLRFISRSFAIFNEFYGVRRSSYAAVSLPLQ